MPVGGIDLNQAALSYYQYAQYLNSVATQAVGIEAQWMRAVPHEKSEDVIFHEYTLYDVDCPKAVKVVTTNASYNPGNFSIDLFGINYEAPFEIEIDVNTWKEVFGEDIMPQKGDIVYIELLNCLYEVATSTIIYGYLERETGFKVALSKYNPKANRRENEAVADTIDTLTTGVEELFSDHISNEVADIVDDPQTSQMLNNLSGNHDEYKVNDQDSVKIEDISVYDNIVAHTYYDMSSIEQSIIYNIGDTISKDDREYSRFFSCWLKVRTIEGLSDVHKLVQQAQKNVFELKDEDVTKNFENGDKIVFSRGSFLHLNATVNVQATINGQKRYLVTFNNSEFREANRRLTNFWNTGLKVKKCSVRPLLLGRTNGECNFNISLIGTREIYIKFGSMSKYVSLNKEIPTNVWIGFAMNIGPASDVFIYQQDEDGHLGMTDHVLIGNLQNYFDVGKFYITESDLHLTNIRLYKTASQIPSSIAEKDLSSQLARNDSKTIINDSAAVPNFSPYITQQK